MSSIGANYASTIIREQAVIVYYRLNEAVGNTVAADSAGRFSLNGLYLSSVFNGHTPLVQGDAAAASFAPGGSDAVAMKVGDAVPLRVGASMSIEAWIISNANNPTQTIIDKGTTGAIPGAFSLGLTAGRPQLLIGNGATSTACTAPTAIQRAIRYHLVGTVNNGLMSLYVNGVLVASQALGAQTIADTAQTLNIGGGVGVPFSGNVAEVALYSSALPAKNVLRHYALGRVVIPDPAHYIGVDTPVFS